MVYKALSVPPKCPVGCVGTTPLTKWETLGGAHSTVAWSQQWAPNPGFFYSHENSLHAPLLSQGYWLTCLIPPLHPLCFLLALHFQNCHLCLLGQPQVLRYEMKENGQMSKGLFSSKSLG